MKTKQMVLWTWRNIGKVNLIWFFICFCTTYIIICTAITLSSTAQDATMNGIVFSSLINLLVIGIIAFPVALRFGLGNSVSRRTIFKGLAGFSLWIAAVSAAADLILILLFSQIIHTNGDIIGMLYPGYRAEHGEVQFYLLLVCSTLLFLLAFNGIGLCIGGAYYRMNKQARVIVSVSVPLVVFFILPLLITLFPDSFGRVFGGLLESAFELLSNPLWLLLALACIYLLSFFFLWLLIRRAPAERVR